MTPAWGFMKEFCHSHVWVCTFMYNNFKVCVFRKTQWTANENDGAHDCINLRVNINSLAMNGTKSENQLHGRLLAKSLGVNINFTARVQTPSLAPHPSPPWKWHLWFQLWRGGGTQWEEGGFCWWPHFKMDVSVLPGLLTQSSSSLPFDYLNMVRYFS